MYSCNGNAKRLSVDHTAKVQEEIDRVHSVGGKIFLGCLADPKDGDAEITVTRGFGNFNLEPGFTPEPYISEAVDLSSPTSEFVILASDGLWDTVSDQDAVSLARERLLSGCSPESVSQMLAETAADRGSKDDTTVVICSISAVFLAAADAAAAGVDGAATRTTSVDRAVVGGGAFQHSFVSPSQSRPFTCSSPCRQV